MGKFMNKWKEYKVSEMINIIGGGTPKTKFSEYWDGDIPWLSVKDFNTDLRKVYDTEKCITQKGLENSSTKLLDEGDIIISARGTVGALAQLGKTMAFNQSCYGLRAKEITTNDFVYYLLKNMIGNIQQNTHGSVFDTITRDTFDILKANLPPIQEQKAIAHILSTLDDKIEVNNQINKTLENMAQAIFKQWFVDFEFPNEDGEPYKSSGGEMVESELGMIPKGWKVKPFEDAFYFQEGPGIRNWQYVEKGTKFINIRCIQDNDLYLETANMISFEEAEGKYKHFMIDSGDIVMSTSGTLGRYAIVREEHLPLCLNTSVIRFKPLHRQEHYSYMYAYLTSNEFLNHLTTKASGSVQKNFGPMHLRQIKLLYPNVSIIKLLNDIISPIIKSSLHTKKENDKLKKLRDTLLPKLMSGEIRVKDAEKMVEDVA